MSQIQTYKFAPRQICVYPEIWDAQQLRLNPIEDMDNFSLYEVLDSIVLAVEAGVVDNFLWPQQIFANRIALENFIEQLSDYDECYRITDQWWCALAALCEVVDEEAFVSSAEIACQLLSCAHEDGKIENFGHKAPTYKYSVAECIEAELTMSQYAGTGYSDSLLPVKERLRAQEVQRFGRYYSEQATKAQWRAAFRKGQLALKAQIEAERSAAKTAKVKGTASRAARSAKTVTY